MISFLTSTTFCSRRVVFRTLRKKKSKHIVRQTSFFGSYVKSVRGRAQSVVYRFLNEIVDGRATSAMFFRGMMLYDP